MIWEVITCLRPANHLNQPHFYFNECSHQISNWFYDRISRQSGKDCKHFISVKQNKTKNTFDAYFCAIHFFQKINKLRSFHLSNWMRSEKCHQKSMHSQTQKICSISFSHPSDCNKHENISNLVCTSVLCVCRTRKMWLCFISRVLWNIFNVLSRCQQRFCQLVFFNNGVQQADVVRFSRLIEFLMWYIVNAHP